MDQNVMNYLLLSLLFSKGKINWDFEGNKEERYYRD